MAHFDVSKASRNETKLEQNAELKESQQDKMMMYRRDLSLRRDVSRHFCTALSPRAERNVERRAELDFPHICEVQCNNIYISSIKERKLGLDNTMQRTFCVLVWFCKFKLFKVHIEVLRDCMTIPRRWRAMFFFSFC